MHKKKVNITYPSGTIQGIKFNWSEYGSKHTILDIDGIMWLGRNQDMPELYQLDKLHGVPIVPDSHLTGGLTLTKDMIYELLPHLISFITDGSIVDDRIDTSQVDKLLLCMTRKGFINDENKPEFIKVPIFKIPFTAIYCTDKSEDDCEMEYIGYIDMKQFNAQEAWHLCNWMSWSDTQPESLHAPVGRCNREVVFHNPQEHKYYIPTISGWTTRNTEEEVKKFYIKGE